MIIFLISLFFAILLESAVTTIPLTLLIILFLAVTQKEKEVFTVAFFAGLILDILSFGRIGFSSLFFTLIVYLVFMYQKKFETDTINFMIIFSFVGSFLYLFLQGTSNVILQSLFATLLVVTSYIVFRKFNKKILKYA